MVVQATAKTSHTARSPSTPPRSTPPTANPQATREAARLASIGKAEIAPVATKIDEETNRVALHAPLSDAINALIANFFGAAKRTPTLRRNVAISTKNGKVSDLIGYARRWS